VIRVISATRLDERAFHETSYLGRSYARLKLAESTLSVAFENRRGLPEIYNQALAAAAESDILVFVHDDVWIEDWQLETRLHEGLSRFDVVGLAGCVQRAPRQPRWWLLVEGVKGPAKRKFLSGAVRHGTHEDGKIAWYGPAPRSVVLLDGLFLAVKAGPLQRAGVRFDERFRFHFYDLDFCRSCEAAKLSMGTWPIAVLHASAGEYQAPEWQQACDAYFEKWRE
jgi:hypothetical protein